MFDEADLTWSGASVPAIGRSLHVPSAVEAARHICEEARVVLSFVRSGPPAVAHGELAQSLVFLRRIVKSTFLEHKSTRQDQEEAEKKAETSAKTELEEHDYDEAMQRRTSDDNIVNANDSKAMDLKSDDSDTVTSSGTASGRLRSNKVTGSPASRGMSVRKNYPPFGGHTPPASPLSRMNSVNKIHASPNTDLLSHHFDLPSLNDRKTQQTGGSGVGLTFETTKPVPTLEEESDGDEADESVDCSAVKPRQEVSRAEHHEENSVPGPAEETTSFTDTEPHEALSEESHPPNIIGSETTTRIYLPAPPLPPAHPFSHPRNHVDINDEVGPYAYAFVAVIMDPRAAGPQTLAAIRALHRLLARGSLLPVATKRWSDHVRTHDFTTSLEAVMRGILLCKFEQTDAGADEAVEMAIADFYSLAVQIDVYGTAHSIVSCKCKHDDMVDLVSRTRGSIRPETRMEAFNTVFVNRNTWVHSPALCYHFDTVLQDIVTAAFAYIEIDGAEDNDALRAFVSQQEISSRPILDFLVQQLLHTPLLHVPVTLNGGARNYVNEAQSSHDATRVLCLKLTRCALRTGWNGDFINKSSNKQTKPRDSLTINFSHIVDNRVINYPSLSRPCIDIVQDDLCLSLILTGQTIGNGLSIQVLSEICSTISTLWSIPRLRSVLAVQMESIFTGFFQRTMVLLQQRPVPEDSLMFNANAAFDSECEVVLETLVDLMSLHKTSTGSNWCALEEMYFMYDCSIPSPDVACGVLLELCNSCRDPNTIGLKRGFPRARRHVPAHLKELCAEALAGILRSLFSTLCEQSTAESNSSECEDKSEMKNPSLGITRRRKQVKKVLREAAVLFNEKAKSGIQYLEEKGVFNSPVTPREVALFLRQGIVLGLDKIAVGSYLGEAGKAPAAGKNPHACERDWFHQQTLKEYCELFHFKDQPLLDCLRMFLTSFRLPGEAQQIDRILQAFAESCGRLCNEAANLKYFSEDSKKAADAAYLLAFSIIMLNTDLHNANIRPDRKMSSNAFVLNNTNYGRDITDPGKELPREFLENIYDSIKEEEIRTEGEGAEGLMTVERWKDVMRSDLIIRKSKSLCPDTEVDADLADTHDHTLVVKNMMMEDCCDALLGAIGGFWGYGGDANSVLDPDEDCGSGGMLDADGARLGMDVAVELLAGLRALNRKDLSFKVFAGICNFSGLLRYDTGTINRVTSFVRSVQRQSALVVAMNFARESGDFLDLKSWKMVWAMILELRDLKLLGVQGSGLLMESDPDVLTKESRIDFTIHLIKHAGDAGSDPNSTAGGRQRKGIGGVFGAVNKIFFGSNGENGTAEQLKCPRSVHGKEELVIWNELSPSDEEDEHLHDEHSGSAVGEYFEGEDGTPYGSPGALFESQLIHEDHMVFVESPARAGSFVSARARVRKRLASMCDFYGLVADSRFLPLGAIKMCMASLMSLINDSTPSAQSQAVLDTTITIDDRYLVSPASEALAEVLLCEMTLKNRDRFGLLWDLLRLHYTSRLGTYDPFEHLNYSTKEPQIVAVRPGIEKCATGLLRICVCMISREECADNVCQSLSLLYHADSGKLGSDLDKHLGEGLWRICRNVDGLHLLRKDGWVAVLGLAEYCISKGGGVILVGAGRGGLAEDDPALHAFRSFHLMLHTAELECRIPFSITTSIRSLILCGEQGGCMKLCVAGLDLLSTLHTSWASFVKNDSNESTVNRTEPWSHWWPLLVEGISEAAKTSQFGVSYHLKVNTVLRFLSN